MGKSLLSSIQEVLTSEEGKKAVTDFKLTLAQGLKLCFVNASFWIFVSIVIQLIEGSTESSFKCGNKKYSKKLHCRKYVILTKGVKRVRRDFIDVLWNETSEMGEHEWKSSARSKLIRFEDQLHEAVEAGIHTYSGQKAWSLGNALLYTFSVMTTTGACLFRFFRNKITG